jgi:protein-S-isoprenylcysteine O-methyltransferase Ste14
MADEMTKITTGRLRRFDRAVREKWNKYTWSGLAALLVGLLVLVINMTFVKAKAVYPTNMLLIGLGILLIIIGVIRILIGFITPATPLDTIPVVDQDEALQQEILQTEPGTD